MYQLFLKNVPLSSIRHNDLHCYVTEGFGAKPIEEWPFFSFFESYVSGERETAIQNFKDWYKDQLDKYHNVPKNKGGMLHGSLYSLLEEKCDKPFIEVDESCKDKVIYERVLQRFKLLEDIDKFGYKENNTERIDAFKKNGNVYLRGGHHRAAILLALNKKELPNVLVFPNELTYNLFHLLRTIKHGYIQK